jgi:hypothetical protein
VKKIINLVEKKSKVNVVIYFDHINFLKNNKYNKNFPSVYCGDIKGKEKRRGRDWVEG